MKLLETAFVVVRHGGRPRGRPLGRPRKTGGLSDGTSID